ncbi:SusC/RagA family TonB-linked outer membrane protein [Neolewinella lacunae]|uniref:SusC/RagA family TonB-linked outer membrane protein n=1 Tax=Neolewinella lacunae TaxID=1517758 RepID=A0A923PG22_9BACT|nr:SusC/RagA family TonB-linked outer membrane protein [Neolewinella lacunae]MBC6993407.1 SusC/RagA family TonB-linked outer membrane protein [Neolewinella lacunae]MDN3636317.1 SusC/RagA family TonB-linked outer membrane protein [Neolewinella lacunae]
MLHSRTWATLLGLLFAVTLTAQNQFPISGQVTDADSGEPLVGASVFARGRSAGTVTDAEGKFTFAVSSAGETIVFSYTGYETQELYLVGAAGAADVVVAMEVGTALSEVVVTALGLKRDYRELGYAVQQIGGEALTDVQAVNFLDNLAGQVAGLRVTTGATGVGSTSQIVIRGQTSFANNNPLFIVDGTPINNNTIINVTNEAAAGFQEIDFGNGAMEVNPADVESVSVLKGASAAALYGTRAANGVVVITTKSGGRKPGLGVSFNSSFTVDNPFQLPRFQNEFGQGQGGAFAFVDGLGAGTSDNITYSYGQRLDVGNSAPQFDSPVTLPDGRVVRGGDVAVHGGRPITPTPLVSQPDNVKDFFRTGTTAINNLAISGGGEFGDFRLSATDLRSASYIPGVNLDRKTLFGKFSFRPTDKLTVNANLSYVNSQSDNRPGAGYGSENIGYSLFAWYPRQANTESLRNYWQPGLEGTQQYSFNYTFFDNPFFTLLENRNPFNRDRLFGNLSASYEFSPTLRATVRSGMDYSNEQRRFLRNFSSNRFVQGGYAENDVFYREINTDVLLDYRPQLSGNFSLNLLAGANRLDQEARNTQRQALTLAQPGIFRLSNAASPVEIFDQVARKRINSVYALAKIGFKNFLYLDVTGRNDWSSALATPTNADNTSFFYPSVSLSFLADRAFDLPQAISFLQLRANWAQVGNDTDPYRTSSTFVARTPFGGQPTFSEQAVLAAANLLPEQTTSTEVGVDVRLADDRIGLDLTYFTQQTENQILSLPVPLSSGYREQIINGGSVSANGLEAILSLRPVWTDKFKWQSRFNFSTTRARVDALPEGTERFTLAFSRVYNSVDQTVFFIVEPGGEIGDIWGTGYLKNEAGEFVLTAAGNYIADNTLRKLGNANPDFMLGFQNNFRFGNFDLGLLLDWRQGGEVVSRTLALAAVGGQLEETANRPETGIIAQGVQNTGSSENPVYVPNTVAISAESYYRSFYDRNHEENNIYDASFLKIREVSLTYRLGREQLSDTFLSSLGSLSISVIGRNLYAFTKIPHFDPEQFAIQGQNLVGGVEDISYPTARSFGINLGVEF